MLIYADNSIIDPWVVADRVLNVTKRLAPLVAVQPIYMHPYSVAKKVVSFGFMYQRQVCLNMIAGGFRGDLLALGDPTPHDERYARLIEYTQIIQRLLKGDAVSLTGAYYTVQNLRLSPAMMAPMPQILMSGSSDAGRAAVIELGITGVEYPEPAHQIDLNKLPASRGIRVGIIADDDRDIAWRRALERFPPDRRGQLQQAMAVKVSDSSWHQILNTRATEEEGGPAGDSPYWLWPYKQYATFCPYLVGTYQRVAEEIARYLQLGYKTFILDIPREEGDLVCAQKVFQHAVAMTC